jgi:site-specific DNA recombinase
MADRAAIYLRVSSSGQALDGTSLETQEKQCRQRCAEKGYQVVAVETDTETGMDSAGYRPGLKTVRSLLDSGAANVLLIWKLDRMSRESTDNLLIAKTANKAGARLESYVEGPIPAGQLGRMQLFMAGEAAQAERDSIVLRTREGLQRRVEAGMPIVGAAPRYGYQYTYGPGKRIGTLRKTGYEVNEDTAAVMRRCYELVDAGSSLNNLARQLNKEGVLTPTQYLESKGLLKPGHYVATSWTRQTLYNLLACPTYKGSHVANRYKTVKVWDKDNEKPRRLKQLRDEEDDKRMAIATPAIVDEALWARVQAKMTANKNEASRHNPDPDATLFRAGFGICGVCGGKLSTGKGRDGTRLYVCGRGKEGTYKQGPDGQRPVGVCTGGAFSLRTSMVDGPAWEEIAAMARDPEKMQRIVDWRRKTRQTKLDTAQSEAENVDEEIAECQANLAKAKRRMEQADGDDEYAMWKEKWRRETALLVGLEKKQARADTTVTLRYANLEKLKQLMVKYSVLSQPARYTWTVLQEAPVDPLANLSTEEKREIMRLLGVHVLMYPTDSDYVREHNGKRYEVRCDEESDCVSNNRRFMTQYSFTYAEFVAFVA